MGLALNALVSWHTLCMDAAVKKPAADWVTVSSEIRSRLSPLVHEHIHFHGRYPLIRWHGDGAPRPLRNPDEGGE
ncbi:Tn3 family transposase [Streptomyces nigrescens]